MNEVQKIELSMDDLKAKIKSMKLLHRLKNNKDFKAFILDDFCNKRALDMLTKSVSPGFQEGVNKEFVKNQLIAVGSLKLFMSFIEREGEAAVNALAEAEAERQLAFEEEEEEVEG